MEAIRKTYETASDRYNEKRLLDEFSKEQGCHVIQTKRNCSYDGIITEMGKMSAIVEVKNRTHRYSDFSTLKLSCLKMTECATTAKSLLVPYYLIVEWSDAAGFIRYGPIEVGPRLQSYRIDEYWGRKDPRDPMDFEPVFMIPVSEFKLWRHRIP